MMETKYYLIAPLRGDNIQVNELYAPSLYGYSLNFTVKDIADLLKVRRNTALKMIEAWRFEGICKEVI